MDQKNLDLAAQIVGGDSIERAKQAINSRKNQLTILLANRKLPDVGWDNISVRNLMNDLKLMDSNNFINNIGIGEREARVYSEMVENRHFNMCHGVGRSGDITADQPKATGSSLLSKLCHFLTLDCLKICGLANVRQCLILPIATGMSIMLTLLTLRNIRPITAKYVVWTRVDQKSCLKAIVIAGFAPIVVPNVLNGEEVKMDHQALVEMIKKTGHDNILCIITTSSCFAPRVPDEIDQVARLCLSENIPHVINNAYGLQCKRITSLINRSMAVGRVDAVVQSTDKNFLVPVGGAVVCGPNKDLIKSIGKAYAGRASSSPVIDMFVTLLSMGRKKYAELLEEREKLSEKFRSVLSTFAESKGEHLVESRSNSISFAVSLERVKNPTEIGAMLFARGVTGVRVIENKGDVKNLANIDFLNYGASIDAYPFPYLTLACAIGSKENDLERFVGKLEKVYDAVEKKLA
mmetsp:Transcript_17354/g.25723  ORF Transcript_17354/g.25723 Transcript_17354/m.25723 type:complete len:464 (+) Transcript_17354:164-1555(+)